MQFIFNILYKICSYILIGIGSVLSFPDWFVTFFKEISEFLAIANYYLPIQEFFGLAVFVVSCQVILMVISAVLQLL